MLSLIQYFSILTLELQEENGGEEAFWGVGSSSLIPLLGKKDKSFFLHEKKSSSGIPFCAFCALLSK